MTDCTPEPNLDLAHLLTMQAVRNVTMLKRDAKRLKKKSLQVFGTEYPLGVCQQAMAVSRGFASFPHLQAVSEKLGHERHFMKIPGSSSRMKALTALSDFEHGFVTAAALAARLGDPYLAAKMLGNAGFQALDCSELNAVDKQQLQLVNQQPGMKLTGLGKHN